MTFLFALTIFTGSALIFVVQPMITKMVLPLLGGTPAVWNTAMMFFQAALLAGYAYAHWASRALGFRLHAAVHIGLMAAAMAMLPVAVGADARPPADANPVFWLIGLLAVAVGLPFTIIAANATLLQRWLARTDHAAAANPYFLYSASNLGSMLALLAYPSAIEPLMTLGLQSRTWMVAFVALAALTAGCAFVAARRAGPERAAASEAALVPLAWAERGHWLLLSFAPSSLLLGLTTYLTTDIAAVPLLWVIPLALYLLTFVIVFARRPAIGHDRAVLLQPFFLLPLLIFMFWGGTAAVAVLYPLHLIVFFLTALVCHGELARRRPAPGHLTEFYLWLSVGGLLGGVFNALVAPVAFDAIIEYPLAIALAVALRPHFDRAAARFGWSDVAAAVVLGAAVLGLTKLFAALGLPLIEVPDGAEDEALEVRLALLIFISCAVGIALYSFRARALRFGLGVGVVLFVGAFWFHDRGGTLLRERNFFGVVAVASPIAGYNMLRHGTTVHGAQSLDPARRAEPLTYFSLGGPLGQAMTAWAPRLGVAAIAVTGLGVGSIACYRQPGQRWTFYEIDPAVERIARDARYFTYLAHCAPDAEVVLGDARLRVAEAADGGYAVMILDAFRPTRFRSTS